jgi:hypothetical protein
MAVSGSRFGCRTRRAPHSNESVNHARLHQGNCDRGGAAGRLPRSAAADVVMTEQHIAGLHDEDAAPLRDIKAPVVRSETLMPFLASIGLHDGGTNSDSARRRESSPDRLVHGRGRAPAVDNLWRTSDSRRGDALPHRSRGAGVPRRLYCCLQLDLRLRHLLHLSLLRAGPAGQLILPPVSATAKCPLSVAGDDPTPPIHALGAGG